MKLEEKSEKIIIVDPSECCRWKFADRSEFEFVKIQELADDIEKNGQFNPSYNGILCMEMK